jgi:RNA polymerase sigma-70 factor (ECF subfamily)
MLLGSRPREKSLPSSPASRRLDEASPGKGGAEAGACGSLTAEAVFHAHAARVYNLARRMLNNDTDAEDVSQDVLLQVVRKLDTFRGDAELTTWLHRVTVNAALALRRRRARHPEMLVDAPLEVLPSVPLGKRSLPAEPGRLALDRELRQILEQAIAALPAMYRDVYVLSDVEGLANAEIGELLGLSLPAVKSRLHRARLLLRDVLAPHFPEGRP